ncbi:hypothetical protein QBC37DRAFT_447859 [Rhypophila decipiens]|uniref:RING-type domain-containing protein n=1 Tax=Rhypophila decipiens TaxID=261697 RepID=A0AAN6Y1B8_9PEZI|nr:hypothetical protein QBC37DRAFT_447859 [Rhypophila decipiens]
MEAHLTCSICQEIFVDPVETSPCEHNFCDGCLKRWLEANHTCPECRSPVTSAQPKRNLACLVEAFLRERPDRQVSTAAAAQQRPASPDYALVVAVWSQNVIPEITAETHTNSLAKNTEWQGQEWEGQEWPGQEWPGQEWEGQEWEGQEWPGQEWRGQEYTGQK